MRGLPCTGKTFTARRLAGDSGLVCETDEFFHTQVGEDPAIYSYDPALMESAREWNFERFREAVERGVSPVVVDRGNGLGLESRRYAEYAREHGYRVALAEPESEWWGEIRVLLKYRPYTFPVLRAWAVKLAEMSQSTHRVPAEKVWSRMHTWRHGLRIEDIYRFDGDDQTKPDGSATAPPNAATRPEDTAAPQIALSIPVSPMKDAERQPPGSDDWLHDLLGTEANNVD